jgi:hypothetical protein
MQGPLGEDRSRLAIPVADQLHSMTTPAEVFNGRIKAATAAGNDAQALSLASSMANGDTPDFSAAEFVMVVEWDLRAPYVILHKGDYAARTMHFGGWPEMTKGEFDAQDPVDPAL